MAAKVKQINFDELDRGTRFVRLVTPINTEELAEVAGNLAARTDQVLTIKREKSEALTEFREQLKEAEDAQKELLGVYKTQTREVDVQCEVGYDWSKGICYTKRLDTGDIVNPAGSPIPDEDRQLQLEGMDAAAILRQRAGEQTEAKLDGIEYAMDEDEAESEPETEDADRE